MSIARQMPTTSEGGDLDIDHQRARQVKENADAKAMDNAERRGELVSRPDITLAFASVIALAASSLQLVPDVIARGDNALRELAETAMADALEKVSMTRVEEALGGGLDEEEDRESKDEGGN